ncbi:MAG TPA: UbiA family prenyltransferase, partial [Streptosporangiaceae bacterium]|nr:UbiA family prenyltransferase [Streptosporangiaceae bacterium]
PPHFWALAMKFKDDYAAASVPMLPVVAPPTVVARKILLYSYVMVVTTLLLAPYAGWLYAASAAGLGAWFLLEAHRLRARVARIGDGGGPAGAPGAPASPQAPASPKVEEGACAGVVQPSANPAPMRLFHLSIAYLTLLFAVIAITSLLPWGSW